MRQSERQKALSVLLVKPKFVGVAADPPDKLMLSFDFSYPPPAACPDALSRAYVGRIKWKLLIFMVVFFFEVVGYLTVICFVNLISYYERLMPAGYRDFPEVLI